VSAERLERVRAALRAAGIDALMLGPSADFRYLTGYETMPMERLTMLVLPAEGDARIVTPAFEAPLAPDGLGIEIDPWGETDDPIARAVDALPNGARRLAAGDQLDAMFLLPLQARIDADWVLGSEVMRPLRMVKAADEIAALADAGAAIDRAIGRVPELLHAGVTERELAFELDRAIRDEGHEQTDFTDIGSGPNGASPHHSFGPRVVDPGDVVVVDIGGRMPTGYRSDITRTFALGDPGGEFLELYAVLEAAQAAGRAAVRPGATCESVDAACRDVIAEAGYGELFIHRTGHGIGLDVHEDPYIVEGESTALEPGMVFSIEPGIYVPGRFGARIEDIIAVTDDGARSLNGADRSLVRVG
jgi:Xaa-Pro aminopeptidase